MLKESYNMNNNIVRGEVTYVLRDAKTDEIIREHTQENIITENFYTKLLNTWQFGFNIVVTNAIMEPSRYTTFFPGSGTGDTVTQYPSRIIPALGVYSAYYDASPPTEQYVQFAGRYDAPAIGSTRVINSVCLGARVSAFYGSPTTTPDTDSSLLATSTTPSSRPQAMAFLKLTSPCIQTDQQVLDVYYRLFFPHTATTTNIPYFIYSIQFISNNWTSTNFGGYPGANTIYPFRLPKVKAGDEGLTTLPYRSMYSLPNGGHPTSSLNTSFTLTNSAVVTGVKGVNQTDATFTVNAGTMITSVMAMTSVPTYAALLSKTNKIQNLIGTAQELTSPTAPSFLDVDNLPTGTGKVYLSGTWNNIGTPSSPGLYYSSILPEYNRIVITTSGAVATSQYKIVRQKFFGYMNRLTNIYINSNYRTPSRIIPALSPSGISANGTTVQYDNNRSIAEDITETFFSVQQLSACCRFDDSSFIWVKKNKIILYSLGAGEYWKINGTYTNIHQIAVMNNKIYIACRDTGLWVVDPYSNLTPVSLSSPGDSINLSTCHGVAKGYGNIIWAVGANCLASFDGTTWSRYDSTTSPAFTMTGISDGNWSNISYIKVDEDSATNEMLLVRKFDATSDSTLLGVWWSTAGVTSNTGAEATPTSITAGRPRVHRGHVGGQAGYWIMLTQGQWRRMVFGSTAFTSITNVLPYTTTTAINSTQLISVPSSLCLLYQSATFVKNALGQVRSWHSDAATVQTSGNSDFYSYGLAQETVDSTGTIDVAYTGSVSSMSMTDSEFQPGYGTSGDVGSTSNYLPAKTSTQGSYSGAMDMAHNFVLCPGIMITVNSDGGTSAIPSTPANRIYGPTTRVTNFGLDYTQSGGAMAYVAQQQYGWNGSAWELNNSSGKPTHTTTDALFDGVTVRFENGGSGTSFQTPNLYKFGLCEGILKDNATRGIYQANLYAYRKTTPDVTDLESSVVPSSRSGTTGIVGININNTSGNVSTNVNGDVIFPGQNNRQYAVGDKQLVGDFVLSIDVSSLNATDVRNSMMVGITREGYWFGGLPYIAWFTYAGTLYTYDGGTETAIGTIGTGTTSLEIRRVGPTITLWRNGVIARTITSTGIRINDLNLDVMYSTYTTVDTVYLPVTGTRAPRATIVSNGSVIYANMGSSSLNTGYYSPRFYGVDIFYGAGSFTMNGTAVTPKTDGTAPLAGEITIDNVRGTMYFNSADIGKSITARYTTINS